MDEDFAATRDAVPVDGIEMAVDANGDERLLEADARVADEPGKGDGAGL